MINIPFIANLYETAREKNILAGLIIIDLIAFISSEVGSFILTITDSFFSISSLD